MKIYCICGRWCKSQESLYAHKKYCSYKNINTQNSIVLNRQKPMDHTDLPDTNTIAEETETYPASNEITEIQLHYLNFQNKIKDTTDIFNIKTGFCNQMGSPERGSGNLYHYLEVVNFVESSKLTNSDGDSLLELIKWITFDNGKELHLPSEYKYLKTNLKEKLKYR
jgi:hypothetical protein